MPIEWEEDEDLDDCPYGENRCSWPDCDCYDDVESDIEDLSEIVKRFNVE